MAPVPTLFKRLLGLDDGYRVLFVQGGAGYVTAIDAEAVGLAAVMRR